MMMKISAMAFIPLMLVAALLLKPELIGIGAFITAIVIEFFVLFLVMDYVDD